MTNDMVAKARKDFNHSTTLFLACLAALSRHGTSGGITTFVNVWLTVVAAISAATMLLIVYRRLREKHAA